MIDSRLLQKLNLVFIASRDIRPQTDTHNNLLIRSQNILPQSTVNTNSYSQAETVTDVTRDISVSASVHHL